MSRLKGEYFEDLAVDYLRLKGFKILARNYRRRGGEIDIIAQRKRRIYFLEVKARKSSAYYSGYEAVDKSKWKRIERLAAIYAQDKGGLDFDYGVISLAYGNNWIEFMFMIKN
ncbi:MAG: YraN family protein [Candidatus Omnitrophica bacterium]|nr:YraN family protein [Candidatus Omnitrophota bacterium]